MGKKSRTEREAMIRSMSGIGAAIVAKQKPNLLHRFLRSIDKPAAAITLAVVVAVLAAKVFS